MQHVLLLVLVEVELLDGLLVVVDPHVQLVVVGCEMGVYEAERHPEETEANGDGSLHAEVVQPNILEENPNRYFSARALKGFLPSYRCVDLPDVLEVLLVAKYGENGVNDADSADLEVAVRNQKLTENKKPDSINQLFKIYSSPFLLT